MKKQAAVPMCLQAARRERAEEHAGWKTMLGILGSAMKTPMEVLQGTRKSRSLA